MQHVGQGEYTIKNKRQTDLGGHTTRRDDMGDQLCDGETKPGQIREAHDLDINAIESTG